MRGATRRVGRNCILFAGFIICVLSNPLGKQDDDDNEVDKIKSGTQSSSSSSSSSSLNLLPSGYNKYDAPPPLDNRGSRELINVTLLINQVPNLNENEQEISFVLHVKLYWMDARLANLTVLPGKTLPRSLHGEIWTPEISVGRITSYALADGTLFGHYDPILKPPIIGKFVDEISIEEPARISYVAQLDVTHSCDMYFVHYPLDVQQCELRFVVEVGERVENSLLRFNPPFPGLVYQGNYDTQNFEVGLQVEDAEPNSKPRKQLSPSISFYFARKFGFHLLLVYPPSMLLNLISWFTLFLPVDQTTDRISVGVTVLLTLIALFGTVRLTGPSVSYVKAVDTWLVVSVIFTFVVITETFVVVNVAKGNISVAALRRLRLLLPPLPSSTNSSLCASKCCSKTGGNHSCNDDDEERVPPPPTRLSIDENSVVDINGVADAGEKEMPCSSSSSSVSLFASAAHRLDVTTRVVTLSVYLIYSTWYWLWLGLYYITEFDKNEIRGCTWCW